MIGELLGELIGELLDAVCGGKSKGPLTSRKAETCDECGGGHYHHPRCSKQYPGYEGGRS